MGLYHKLKKDKNTRENFFRNEVGKYTQATYAKRHQPGLIKKCDKKTEEVHHD